MSPLYFWIAFALVFLIIELMTATFYSLSLSVACAIVALLSYLMHDTAFTIFQGGVFVFSSMILAFLLPKLLTSNDPNMPQGVEKYMGEIRSVRKVGGDLKISLDGVDYPVESDEAFSAGDKVQILTHHGVSMKVKRIVSKESR